MKKILVYIVSLSMLFSNSTIAMALRKIHQKILKQQSQQKQDQFHLILRH